MDCSICGEKAEFFYDDDYWLCPGCEKESIISKRALKRAEKIVRKSTIPRTEENVNVIFSELMSFYYKTEKRVKKKFENK